MTMKNRFLKISATLLLVVAILFAFTGCSLFGGPSKEKGEENLKEAGWVGGVLGTYTKLYDAQLYTINCIYYEEVEDAKEIVDALDELPHQRVGHWVVTCASEQGLKLGVKSLRGFKIDD